ncbi:MAG: imidazoleglycerol-phosphate dehydratase [Candidatus Thermoplasmatota archaeon]|nr:imidazoleglycerol-phosphate dehydratase [Candidatus Thermoplasmatota archaeon]
MRIQRKTKETDIALELDIYGEGKTKIELKPENKFLEHMLTTLAKFANFNLAVRASGKDEHHLCEDIGITLGKALREKLKKEVKIKRIGKSILPMDDALVLVSVDLIERPYVNVDLPNELYLHFLRSFALESKITFHNLILRGREEHHIVEATFKALGLALREALEFEMKLKSTKGEVKWKKT